MVIEFVVGPRFGGVSEIASLRALFLRNPENIGTVTEIPNDMPKYEANIVYDKVSDYETNGTELNSLFDAESNFDFIQTSIKLAQTLSGYPNDTEFVLRSLGLSFSIDQLRLAYPTANIYFVDRVDVEQYDLFSHRQTNTTNADKLAFRDSVTHDIRASMEIAMTDLNVTWKTQDTVKMSDPEYVFLKGQYKYASPIKMAIYKPAQ